MAKVERGWLFDLTKNVILWIVIAVVLFSVSQFLAATPAGAQTIDLGDARAVEQLRTSNPAHYEKVTEIVRELRARPSRAEGNWLQVTFGAQDVDLSRLVMMTSDPPKQSLRFKLDDVQYRLAVVRFDLDAVVVPQNQILLR